VSDDHRLQRAVLQLAPLLALDVGLRGLVPSPDRVQGGGSDHDPREALCDRGELGRARAVSARLAGLPCATAKVLRWIAASAHGLGLREASERYARTHGPVALREAEATAVDGLDRARRSLSLAKVHRGQRARAARSTHVVLPPTPAEEAARGHLEAAEATLREATKALAGYGRAVLVGALDVWDADRDEERAA
jgi:hypothetical protein